KKLLTRVPVYEKLNSQWWVQAHPDPAFRTEEIGLLEYDKDRRMYAVSPRYSNVLGRFYRRYYVFTGITIGGAGFFWCVKMARWDGSWNAWPSSMYGRIGTAMQGWVQVCNTGAGWDVCTPETPKPPPVWEEAIHPCACLDDLINLGFRLTYID